MAVRAHGAMLEVVFRRRIVVLDAFDGSEPPRILWTRDLFDAHWSASNQMRSEIALTGLMTDDRLVYQLGSALCSADLVTGRTVWERRNIPFSYSVEGDQDYVIVLSRSDPKDPFGLVLHAASGAQDFGGLLGVGGPLIGDWHGRRVATTVYTPRRLTRSMTNLVTRKVDWSRSYSMPAWLVPIDDEEFGVIESSRKLHIHSTATGDQTMETQFDEGLNSPQVSVRRVGNRYIVIRQGGAFRVTPRMVQGQPLVESGGMWAVDRDTGKIAWTAAIQPPQMLVDLPAQSPVFVLLRPRPQFEAPRSRGVGTFISILDARTGKTIYEGREAISADQITVRLDLDAHAVIVNADKHRLEITAKPAN
jgi:PQQ-like domain